MAQRETTGGGQQRATRKTDEVEETTAEDTSAPAVKERQDKLTDDVDSLLNEIDDVLEENAEEFIRGYVQKGGQ